VRHVNGRTLAVSPVTQGREAVKQLIAYHNHGVEPQEMPNFYRLTGEMVLVLNNKKDAYYVTTPKTCSCPAAVYNPGPCKHARKYFAQPKKEVATEELTEGAKRLAKPPEESIRPVGKWPGGHNGPVEDIMGVA
jgi:hypothetical protein